MLKKGKKKILCTILAAVMVFSLMGCGGNDADSVGGAAGGANTDMASTGDGTGAQTQNGDRANAGGQTAMGRYVEEETDLSERLSWPRFMGMREDGSIVILDNNTGLLVSRDKGVTWDAETPDWFTSMKNEQIYIGEMTMAPDGTVVVNYDSTPGDNDYDPAVKLILPDGTQVPVEIALTEEDMYVTQVIVSDEGRIFAKTVESIYELNRDGSSEKVLTPEYASWICVKGNLMFIDSSWDAFERPVIYDLNTGDYVEDDVLKEFTEDNYSNRDYNGSDYGTMHLMTGDDDTVYIAGPKGIHRHAIGGNMVEQLVDGNLSLLSNPNYNIISMIQPEDNVFLVLCTGSKLLRFTYDPNVPSVPENMITIYSLREDNNIRQAISLYQTQNPDTFVSYQIGMSNGDAVTREDAVKKLNTEIMAGTGPDLIVLDDLPISSYVDKGLLLDMTDYLSQYSAKEPLFDNIIEAMKINGNAYMAPAIMEVSMIAAKGEYIGNVTDLSGIAEAVEKLRREHPGENIIGICSPSDMMKRFAPTSAPKWIATDGTLDVESIGEYLEQCKRIYDAQMDGLDADTAQSYAGRSARMASFYGIDEYMVNWRIYLDILNYICDEQYLLSGWVEAGYDYQQVMSLDKVKAFEDTKVLPMEGQCSNVFMPGTMLGINATSGHIDAAKGFMDVFLSADVQSSYEGFPLNQKAFDIQFTPREDLLQENGEYTSWATTDSEGNMVSFAVYWPADEQIAAFKSQLATASTAYIPDSVLEKAVFDSGAEYIRGDRTLEDTLNSIERTVAIYMAE